MDKAIYRISLDISRNGIQRTIQGLETGDRYAREIRITLRNGKEEVELPIDNNFTASMYVRTPSSSAPSINECTMDGNEIVYTLDPNDVCEVGTTIMQLKVVSNARHNAERVLVSPRFAVEVWESEIDDSVAESTTTYTALESAIAKATEVYNKRLKSITVNEDNVIVIEYADGTTYESSAISSLAKVFSFKGEVQTIEDLPEDAKNGDVYYVVSEKTNYAKTDDTWNKFDYPIDLSGYATKYDANALDSKIADNTSAIGVERARIDNIIRLPEGSTTGDAELIDARVGADGTTYTNVGSAIRTQISQLNNDLVDLDSQLSESIMEIGELNCVNYLIYQKPKPSAFRGITFTKNSDGSVNVEGTASAETYFNYFNDITNLPIWFKKEKKYKLTYNSINVELNIWWYKDGKYLSGGITTYVDKEFTIPSDANGAIIRLKVLKNKTVSETVKPILVSVMSNQELDGRINSIEQTMERIDPKYINDIYLEDLDESTDVSSLTTNDIYNFFEEIGNYESKKTIGYANGFENMEEYAINLYSYRGRFSDIKNSFDFKLPKVLITGGVHGEEKGSPYNLSRFAKLICDKHSAPSSILSMADIDIVPVVNTWGYTNHSRLNHNMVNINRNFNYKWQESTDPNKGLNPLSESESRAISNLIEENQYDYIIDCHEANLSNGLYIATQNTEFASTFLKTMKRIHNTFLNKYGIYPVNRSQGVAEKNNIPSLSNEMYATKNINNGMIYECAWGVGSSKWKKNIIATGASGFINFIIDLLKQ